jgi:broad specificity phosphatase PhoE
VTSATALTTRLVLVRHGEANGNREFRYLGSTDEPLTARGQEQAAAVARALAPFRLEAIYASPLQRAVATAQAIAAAARLEVRIEAELRESAYGDWEGLTRGEVAARDANLLRRWESDPDVAPPGAGESLRDTQRRIAACADRLAQLHAGATLALVSHVGPVKALVCHALGIGPEGARRMWLDPASVSIVEWPCAPGGRAMVRLYNATPNPAERGHWLASGR